jgi:thiol-disulfide isomerase/thioredoxin
MRISSLFAVALTVALAAPVLAQDDEAERIEALLSDAMDFMTGGADHINRAKTLQGQEAEKARALGMQAYDKAVTKYDQVLELVSGISAPEEALAQVRQLAYYNTACARSMQGKTDEALTAFGQALDAGFDDFEHIGKDTDLDPIRNEARFAQLLERARAKAAEQAREAASEALSKGALFPYDFTVTTLDGKQLSLADLRGKVVIVDFWGTWCPPCRAEIPHFVELKKQYGDKLAIVGMTWENGQQGDAVIAKVKAFAAQTGINYPLTLVTRREDLQKVPDLTGFPTTLFIDKQGRVRAKEVGYRDLEVLQGLVQALDAETAPAAPATPPTPGGGSVGPF